MFVSDKNDRQSAIIEILKDLHDLGRSSAVEVAGGLVGQQDRRTVHGDATIIKEVGVLKRLFNVAIEGEKIAINPAQRAPLPKAPEGRVRYLSAEELGRVLLACPEWLRPIVGLLVSTGTRRGELLKVRWEDVSISRREIRLRHTKSGKERPAFINDLVMQVLMSMGGGSQKQRGLLFPDVTPPQVTVAFIRACNAAGVTTFRSTTFATIMLPPFA
jgi:integrase